MSLLRTADHECRDCPYERAMVTMRMVCEQTGEYVSNCGISPDCPLPIGVEQGALARSAETSQAIEEEPHHADFCECDECIPEEDGNE